MLNAKGEVIADGWMALRKTLRHLVWLSPYAEHMARYSGSDNMPCSTCGRRMSTHGWCESCHQKGLLARWEKMQSEAVDWDGKAPLCVYGSDEYFFDADDLGEWLFERVEDGAKLEDIWLVLCDPDNGCEFIMSEFLQDHLPDEDHGGGDLDEDGINKTVNDWIRSHAPFSWWEGKTPIKLESIKALWDECIADVAKYAKK